MARRRLPRARRRLQGERAAGDRLHGRLLRAPQALAVAADRHRAAALAYFARRRLGRSSRTSTAARAPSSRATATTATAPAASSRTPLLHPGRDRHRTSSRRPTCATGSRCCGRFGFTSLLSPLTLLIAAARVRAQRAVRDRVPAPHRVPLHGARRSPSSTRPRCSASCACGAGSAAASARRRSCHEGPARAARDAGPARPARARWPATTSWGRSPSRCRERPTAARTTPRRRTTWRWTRPSAMIPPRRHGVGQQQRRRAARGAPGRLRLPVLRRGADWVIVDQKHPFFYDKAGPADALSSCSAGWCWIRDFQSIFAQGRRLRVQAGRRRGGRRRPAPRPRQSDSSPGRPRPLTLRPPS